MSGFRSRRRRQGIDESPIVAGAGASLDARVESILHRMRLEEKVGQLVSIPPGRPLGRNWHD